MKKVLITGMSWFLGGIETYLYRTISNMDSKEFSFDFLITYDETPCFYNELKNLGCNFYRVTSRRENFLKNRLEIQALLKTEKYDLVYCNLNSLNYITPCLCARNAGIPVIVHCHNSGTLRGIKTRMLHRINFYRLPKDITRLAVSEIAGKWMFGNKHFKVINNGVDTTMFKYSTLRRKETRKRLDVKEDEKVILHVGAFRLQKNHQFLIRVFNKYHKKNPNSKLFLVGVGELQEEIKLNVEQLGIGDSVCFLGIRQDIPDLLSASDCFVFPSFYEGFPIALIEAETSGIHCVVSDRITSEVIIPQVCDKLSLDDSIDDWCSMIDKKNNVLRKDFFKYVDDLGLGLGKEIEAVSAVFDKCINLFGQ